MELKEPKRKRFKTSPQSVTNRQPLPVVIESVTGITACNSLWPTYIGTYSGDSVIISSSDEMSSLYNMGFFGKGCFSRGHPNFGTAKKDVPFITERQWQRRKLWMDKLLSFTGSESISDDLNGGNVSSSNKNASNELVTTVSDDDVFEISNADSIRRVKNKTSNSKSSSNQLELDNVYRPGPSGVNNSNSASTSNTISTITKHVVLGSTYSDDEVPCSSQLAGSKDDIINQDNCDLVMVINNIGSEDECQPQSLNPRLCSEPIKTAVETLNLSLEEAFFLSYGLGCLQVVDLQGVFLSLLGMWHLYKESQCNFISSYVTYHYFRSKGWVIKSGTKFGGDLLLYKEGPPFYHASYVVLIQEINNKFDSSKNKRQLDWVKLMGLNRIAETANKEVLLCQVVWPSDVTREELNSPKVISKFKVQEVLLRRWNSSCERRDCKETA